MGFSFGELLLIGLVSIVIIGPKDLPKLLRWAGHTIGRMRAAFDDVRRDTGLDEVFRGDFRDLSRLADHLESMDSQTTESGQQLELPIVANLALSEREYPPSGADCTTYLREDEVAYPTQTSSAQPGGPH